MHVIHIASEMAPLAKVGGLADVIYGLSREQMRQNAQVSVILPKYDCLDLHCIKELNPTHRDIWVYEGNQRFNNTIWTGEVDGIRLYLIETDHPKKYFKRGHIYGSPDDINRFGYFSKAVCEYLFQSGIIPDVLHVHDWPTSFIPLLYKEVYLKLGYQIKGVVLTIHNLEHQGKCLPSSLNHLGLKGELFLTSAKLQDPYQPHLINILKGGIIYSDRITTVSPSYEEEIKTAQGGRGLQSTLLQYQNKLTGILNGIDPLYWNPETDPYLPFKYSSQDLQDVIRGKSMNKKSLGQELEIHDRPVPLVGCVVRLVPQKGPLLIEYAIQRTLEKNGQFILLGTSPIPEIDMRFRELQTKYAKEKDIRIHLERDERIARLIYAASDLFIIPSLFEPCGLTQLIAMRFGTIPIVRRTGGLADTVFDIDTASQPSSERNGFTFDFPDRAGVNWALDRAIDLYFKDQKRWHTLMSHAIAFNSGWEQPARQYLAIYYSIS